MTTLVPSPERTLLTYPTPRFTRLLVYGSLTVLAYGYIKFAPEDWVNPKDQHAGTQGYFAWWLALPLVILGFSAFLVLLEGLFLIGRKWKPLMLEFDADNLYITDDNGDRAIPLNEILSIRMVYGKGIFDSARTALYRYAIVCGDPNIPERVTFTVFLRARRAFSNFCDRVKEKNPSVEIKNWATSWDGLARLFRGRQS